MHTCWLCESQSLKLVKSTDLLVNPKSEQFRVSDSNYGKTGNLCKCNQCGFIQCFDFLEPGSFYEEMTDNDYVVSQNARYKEMSRILSFAQPFLGGGKSLLDIGAGTGMLVKRATELGYRAVGIEPSKQFCDIAVEAGLNVTQSIFPSETIVDKFDVITLIDVIEHVNQPVVFLAQVKQKITPGGFVVVSTPDCNSVLARILKWKWWHYRVAHIGYFNQNYLDHAMTKCGFELVGRSRPSWYFNLDYIVERLIKFISKKEVKIPFLMKIQVRVNLRDSILCVYRAL